MFLFKNIIKIYASSIFKLSKKKKNIKFWKKMLLFCVKIVKNKYFKFLLKNEISKKKIFLILFGICKNKINKEYINLIKIMILNKHLLLFKKILKKLINLQNKYKKYILIKIITSNKLNKNKKKKIKKKIKKEIKKKNKFKNKKFFFKFFKNKSIIGGIIIKIQHIIYNSSICEFLKKF